ncbi:MAG: SRPBCC family protein [Acidimicrobiia bacterium]
MIGIVPDRVISLSARIEAPPPRVWAELADFAGQSEWMSDVTSIEFATSQRSGLGTRMIVGSRVGPFRVQDLLEVIAWDEPNVLSVAHRGRVKGTGEFRLDDVGGATKVTWSEDLEFPWYMGGRLGIFAARPILLRIWRRSLALLTERVLSGR